MPVRAEVVGVIHRPSLSEVLELNEDAALLPLDVHENIEVRTVVVLPLVLAGEGAGDVVPLRAVPFGVPPGVDSQLHVHNSRLYRELQEPFEIEGKCGQRQHVLIG